MREDPAIYLYTFSNPAIQPASQPSPVKKKTGKDSCPLKSASPGHIRNYRRIWVAVLAILCGMVPIGMGHLHLPGHEGGEGGSIVVGGTRSTVLRTSYIHTSLP